MRSVVWRTTDLSFLTLLMRGGLLNFYYNSGFSRCGVRENGETFIPKPICSYRCLSAFIQSGSLYLEHDA